MMPSAFLLWNYIAMEYIIPAFVSSAVYTGYTLQEHVIA